MKNLRKLRNNTALSIMLMVSGCSMNKSVRVPSLPPNIEQPCESLQEFTKTDAVSNFLWISDTISKYNRCVTAKKEVNNEKP